jgi:glycerophosphoryl diester phosphodiesterase
MVETDVRRSSDGKLILSHDPVLGGYPVAGTPWSTLAELDLGDGHHPALLDEVLAALPDTRVQVEIKNEPGVSGFEPDHRLALEAAERARPGDIVTSFNEATLGAVRRVFPDVPTGLAYVGQEPLDEVAARCVSAGHGALVPFHGLVVGVIPEDLEVYPWTVNSRERGGELAALGVTGIITDDPALFEDGDHE